MYYLKTHVEKKNNNSSLINLIVRINVCNVHFRKWPICWNCWFFIFQFHLPSGFMHTHSETTSCRTPVSDLPRCKYHQQAIHLPWQSAHNCVVWFWYEAYHLVRLICTNLNVTVVCGHVPTFESGDSASPKSDLNWFCVFILLEWMSLPPSLVFSGWGCCHEWTTYYKGRKKKTVKTLDLETAAASSAVLPCVVHLSRWRYGYESHFSSDLRIPHPVQCREAFEALQCSPSQQKQNLWTVYWFTHTDSKVKESWLSYSVTRRGLTFRINYKCLLWWTKASFFTRLFHLFVWVYWCNHYDVKSQAVHQTEICLIIDVYLFELEIFMLTLVFPAEHALL